ncbi:diguanylate cyclase [Kosakonia sacchari]|uniref:diguanylate cyclase domain-containing protein n=1 Tax=Kosakonia sacchari TaxID=1158459 RepID=UPI0025B049FC|nr:diguanylate cyclase [Kosakonia sacchari]MDN2488207.1 diguanylate cyclase [Kosakonia sacchari]
MWKKMLEEFKQNGIRPRVLIVDDQPINIHILNELFTAYFDVLLATNGEKALSLAKEQKPDLILLDIVMPIMDGYEVCRRLKSDPLTEFIPVIFVTAETEADVEAYGFEIGAVDFISKPINPAIVRARVITHIALKIYMDIMRNNAWLDGLTGLHNRRRFDELLQQNWLLCRREHKPIVLMMIDVDFFKSYNDHYGHLAGDDCLRAIASSFKSTIRRATDTVFRYGGEEFACLLPFTDDEGARECANSMLQSVQKLEIRHDFSKVSKFVTISIGISWVIPINEQGWTQLLLDADKALYESKSNGRNKITLLNSF